MNQHPVLGIGFNNWIPYYHRYYNPGGELPHNIFVEAGSELGYLGLGAFVALIVATFVMNYRTRRLTFVIPDWGPMLRNMAYGLDGALVGFMASGFFVTVLYYPFFWVNLAFTAALFETTRRANRRALAEHQARSAPPAPRPAVGAPVAARTQVDPRWVAG
jgi:putative inorganic carbon (hco3(-)) transporter